MIRHWRRLWKAILGQWKPDPVTKWSGMHSSRKSGYAGYWGELGHSLKNVPVELLRKWGIWDRGGKNDRGI